MRNNRYLLLWLYVCLETPEEVLKAGFILTALPGQKEHIKSRSPFYIDSRFNFKLLISVNNYI